MPSSTFSASETVALIFLAGFAIQQLLQIGDPWIVQGIRAFKNKRTAMELPGGVADGDFKKAVMAGLSFLLGLVTAWFTGIGLLKLLKPEYGGLTDLIVSGLVLGTGTEAVNTVLKFLGYVKDAQKPAPEMEISVIPAAASLKVGTSLTFRSSIKNGSGQTTWSVLHGAGGSITSAGIYTAPTTAGVYQVLLASAVDPSKSSIATVTVTA